MHLRSAGLRHPLGHVVGRGPPPLSARRLPARSLRALRGDERAPPRRAPPLLPGRGGHRASTRPSSTSPGRVASSVRLPRWRGPSAQAVRQDLRDRLRRGCGPDQAAGQAGVARRQTGPHAPGTAPGPGRRRGPPDRGAGVPPPLAGPGPVGSGPRHRPPARCASASPPSATWRASRATPCAGPWARPTGASWPRLARGEDPRRVVATRDVKSVGHEETFAVDLARHDGAAPPCGAHGRRRRGRACVRRAWRGGPSR